jgi:FkbM family methyltransferase
LETETSTATTARSADHVVKRFADGLRLVIDRADRGVGLAVRRGRFELNELDFVTSTLRPGQHVVDAGAHAGYYAIHMAASVGASGTVYAFEPYVPSAACLEASVRENGFDDRIVVERVALGDAERSGDLVLGHASRNPGGAFVAPAGYVPAMGERAVRVSIVALDGYPLRRPIAFIKLDVEGAEPAVVAGAERLLGEDRPTILSEVDGFNLQRVAGISPREYIGRLAMLGYRCRLLGAGVPGEEILDWSRSSTASVIFVPESGRFEAGGRPDAGRR